MHPTRLRRIADSTIRRAIEDLPDNLRHIATECDLSLELITDAIPEEEGLDTALLGLFEGLSRDNPEPQTLCQLPRIRLFLDNLWDYSGHDLRRYRREVRVTFLHELGHYLGFDEAGVESLGLA